MHSFTQNIINRLQAENKGLREDYTRACAERDLRIVTHDFIKTEAYKECIEKVKAIATKKKIIYVADASIQERETGWLEIQEEKLDNLLKDLEGK